MKLTRREALLTGSAAALSVSCGRGAGVAPAAQNPGASHLQSAIERALDAARRAGATYADARVVRRTREMVATREDHVVAVEWGESFGIGVRVVCNGAWGFAASSRLEEAEAIARRATEMARANSAVVRRPVALAPVAAYRDRWSTPLERDPFEVPLAEKVEYLLDLWREARAVPGIKHGNAEFEALHEAKTFGSTDGTLVEQSITRVEPRFEVTAVDAARGEFQSRTGDDVPPMQAGWEHVAKSPLRAHARRHAEEAVEKLKSDPIDARPRDLILAPSNLWLTIHESVGHPTELDRALGLEANFAGTSFATVDKLGHMKYAAPAVTLYADKTTPGGLATCGYDDDGVKTQRWDLVKNGLFVGYQTTRDQAAWIGEKASRGTSYAQDYQSFPFQRMPNVSLAPGEKDLSLEDIIAATDDGVLVVGRGSWSIDHQRYNFQFGGQTFHEIKGGKRVRALRDVAYQSNTPAFWNACDMIGGARAWELHGSFSDGKGEPIQSNAVSHGCPPARFKNVNVFSSRRGS